MYKPACIICYRIIINGVSSIIWIIYIIARIIPDVSLTVSCRLCVAWLTKHPGSSDPPSPHLSESQARPHFSSQLAASLSIARLSPPGPIYISSYVLMLRSEKWHTRVSGLGHKTCKCPPSQINANLAIFFSSSGSVSPALVGCDRDIIPRTQTRHSSNLTQIVITSPQPRPERLQQKSINNDCVVGKV